MRLHEGRQLYRILFRLSSRGISLLIFMFQVGRESQKSIMKLTRPNATRSYLYALLGSFHDCWI